MYFVYSWGTMGPALSDYNMRLILLSVIQLSGGHCTTSFRFYEHLYEVLVNNVKLKLVKK